MNRYAAIGAAVGTSVAAANMCAGGTLDEIIVYGAGAGISTALGSATIARGFGAKRITSTTPDAPQLADDDLDDGGELIHTEEY
jgi:hypothetical protein